MRKSKLRSDLPNEFSLAPVQEQSSGGPFFRINDLPVELLIRILTFATQFFDWDEFTNYESSQRVWNSSPGATIQKLRRVCQTWKRAIDTTSSIKGVVVIRRYVLQEQLIKDLNASKKAPLYIYAYTGSFETSSLADIITPILLPHLHRIRTFWEINWGDNSYTRRKSPTLLEIMLKQTNGPLNRLEELVFLSCTPGNTTIDAPNLSTFIVNPPGDKCVLSVETLSSLYRFSLPTDSLRDTTQGYLGHCRHLRTLEMAAFHPESAIEDLYPTDIELPLLDTILFTSSPSSTALRKFFGRIHAPKLRQLTFEGRNDNYDLDAFSASHSLFSHGEATVVQIRLRYITKLDREFSQSFKPFDGLKTLEIYASDLKSSFFLPLNPGAVVGVLCPQLIRLVIRNSLSTATPSLVSFITARMDPTLTSSLGDKPLQIDITEDVLIYSGKGHTHLLKQLKKKFPGSVNLKFY